MKRREHAWLLLKKASEDEALLDEVLASGRISDEIIGFHFQQAAEKILKALLIEFGVEFRRTHNLRLLIDLLHDSGHGLPAGLVDLDVWTPYAALLRYEDLPTEVHLDRSAARQLLRELRTHAERQLGMGS
jgi:HEPN domain-containing protein